MSVSFDGEIKKRAIVVNVYVAFGFETTYVLVQSVT